MSTLKENLQAIKEQLLTKGWIQGRNEDEEGHCCLGGAIWRVVDPPEGWRADVLLRPGQLKVLNDIWDAIHDAIWRVSTGRTSSISWFNDTIAKTVDDVVAVIDDAIARLA